jgi:hypothetical protein
MKAETCLRNDGVVSSIPPSGTTPSSMQFRFCVANGRKSLGPEWVRFGLFRQFSVQLVDHPRIRNLGAVMNCR